MEISDETGQAGRAGTLMVHLLGRCNLQCLHCYMEGSPTRRERLAPEWVLNAIAECEALDIGSLYLTGGEPLLYKELFDILHAASQVPKLEVTLCTNGTLVTPRHAALFRDLGIRVNISVDGMEAFHDYFRNLPGAFRKTERGIRTIVEFGIPLTIVTTISQSNLHSLSVMVEWAARMGAVKFRVQPLLKLGRGSEISDQCLSTEQMNQLLLELSDHANRYREQGLTCSLIGVSRKFLLAHPCGAYVCNGAGCHRRVAKEIKKLVVREDGTVLPEATNLSHTFALGNIEHGPLSVLVSRYFINGYDKFDQLCRTTYAEVLPKWQSVVVPWDQIVAERSHTWHPLMLECTSMASGCQTCSVN